MIGTVTALKYLHMQLESTSMNHCHCNGPETATHIPLISMYAHVESDDNLLQNIDRTMVNVIGKQGIIEQ